MKRRYVTPLLLSAVVLGWDSSGALAQNAAASRPSQQNPQYPVPYGTPSVESVEQAMGRVADRIIKVSPTRFVNRRTGEEVKDVSKPNPDVVLDTGPIAEFRPIAYPMGVIYSGMISAAKATGEAKYFEFVGRRFEFFADHLKDMQAWGNTRENPYRNLLYPQNLDACGAMVASMVKAKRMNVGSANLDPLIEIAANYVHTKQMRLEDGTFCRPNPFPKSLWLDDAYMSVPLLAQYGAMTGKRECFDDAATQIKGFYKHLYVPARGCFTHAATEANEADHPIHTWGRANGWFMVAAVELLELMPEDHPDRAAVIKILKEHVRGIASLQSGTGMWHQLLDRPDSYLETSCTAMFVYSMAKAANHGWIDAASYAPVAVAGWNGLTTKLGPGGEVNDVCIGTNYADDMVYYYHRPAIDDIHGYGPVLLAGAEMVHLLKNPQIRFGQPSRSNANLVQASRRE